MSYCLNYSIPELECTLRESRLYIERWYSDPTMCRDEQQFGFARAVIEFVPFLITLLKLQQTHVLEIKDDHLWQEIDRLKATITKLESSGCDFRTAFPEIVNNIDYHKPDPRLVFEEDF